MTRAKCGPSGLVHREMVLNAISTLLVDDDSHFTWPLGQYYGHSPLLSNFLSYQLQLRGPCHKHGTRVLFT